jgi:hypothetical protein
MRHWLAIGVAGLGIAWGPFLYSEWARKPLKSKDTPVPTASPESQLSAATEAEPKPQLVAAAAPVPAPLPAAAAPDPEAKLPEAAPTVAEPRAHVFSSVFDDEPRDAFWASTEEPKLIGLLQGAGVAEAAIGDVACRKTVCRVAFRSADLEDELEKRVAERMRAEFAELALDMHEPESEQHATLYVLRSGFQLKR